MKVVLLYLGLVVATAGVLIFTGEFRTYMKLADQSVRTTAAVKVQSCSRHQSLRYEFLADNRRFEAVASVEGCTKLTPGTQISIAYSPTDPNLSIVGDPASHLRNEAFSIILAALLLPGFGLWAYSRQRKAGASTPAAGS